ncbi:MAG: hypothetical protein WCQ69_09315 [Bacteroidales bacterium]|jgi:hypothetical protein|nr:hypothetical protein [Bacteroidales bacterium]MDD2264945.1 hypothetical protein [Bacteroidales bacterium]MDD2832113.1 hypothetical protein [Bacteroidales bacterium]MDD3208765.1 hypothetical protein [Bacteroidales bacterium]MDD3697328.1 hypothetical protein [Bacteroidales bacterium]
MNNKSLSFINILLYVGMIVVNALANILPINGMTTGELSDLYPNLFVPAGMTFSIWGVIYILLLIMVIYQVVAVSGKKQRYVLNKNQSFVFALTCILNTAWILTWHYRLVLLSVIVMISLLLSLISLYNAVFNAEIKSTFGKFAYRLTLGVYLGWISIAIIANISALLVSWNWNGFGLPENVWTIIVMLVGLALAVLVTLKNRDIFYPLVFIWAYYGIIVKRAAAAVVHQDIIITAWVSIGLLALLIVYTLIGAYTGKNGKGLLCRE